MQHNPDLNLGMCARPYPVSSLCRPNVLSDENGINFMSLCSFVMSANLLALIDRVDVVVTCKLFPSVLLRTHSTQSPEHVCVTMHT